MRPLLLDRRVRLLGQTAPPFLVRVEDQDGRAVPGVPVERVVVATGEREEFALGPEAAGELPPGAPAGAEVVLRPVVPINFAASPPFARVEAGRADEIVFVVNPRRPERDLVTPVVTFVMGGAASFLVLSLLKNKF